VERQKTLDTLGTDLLDSGISPDILLDSLPFKC
jgi:hypothetical protein